MKKLYYLLFFITGILNAQIVTIPDANFKARLIAMGLDVNSDGEIQQSEALNVTLLSVDASNISDLTGIASFTNLTGLDCSQNQLTSLDLSLNHNLAHLQC